MENIILKLLLIYLLPYIVRCFYIPIVLTDAELERSFDGIGAISGGRATTKLLLNYPSVQQSQILDFLFKPNVGASLQILKVEIGGDGQSSEGTEASHMHEEWDENYTRGYEWWIMSEAKKRNPNITLYGLPWTFPSWVSGYDKFYPYKYPNKTATYIVKWILGAKKYYKLDIDYIGIWNEKPYDVKYIQNLRWLLNVYGLFKVQIVAADMIKSDAWVIADELRENRKLGMSVDVLGGHYVGTWTTPAAQKCGKPLWASESGNGQSTVLGAGCVARILNQNYINGYMTSTIVWNLVTSYYDHIYGHNEISPPIWAVAHTTQFVKKGWKYVRHGTGVGYLPGGGSMVTLVSPDRKDFTIVIETMDVATHGFCITPPQGPYKVEHQSVTLILNGYLKNVTGLNIWWTKLDLEKEEDSIFFKHIGFFKNYNGLFSLNLEVNSIYTLSTIETAFKGSVPKDIPKREEFPRIYNDTFDDYACEDEPFNIVSQAGVFSVQKSFDITKNDTVLRQVIQHEPILWCPLPLLQPTAIIGNHSWSDMEVSIDVYLGQTLRNNTTGVYLAARMDKTGCDTPSATGIFFFLLYNVQTLKITRNLARTDVIYEVDLPLFQDVWYTLSLSIQGNHTVASINDTPVFDDEVSSISENGFVAFGTANYGLAEFDNLLINATQV